MSNLIKENRKTEFNEKQSAISNGTDTSSVTQREANQQAGTSKRVSESERSLTGRTTTTKSSRERVNIGAQITFTVPIRITTPIAPGASC